MKKDIIINKVTKWVEYHLADYDKIEINLVIKKKVQDMDMIHESLNFSTFCD